MPKVTSKKKFFLKKFRSEQQVSSTTVIKPGLKGILATTNGNTGLAVKQLYQCLNNLNDAETASSCEENIEMVCDDNDIDKIIEIERQKLKKFKYKSLPTKLKNTLFISSNDEHNPSPNQITSAIFKSLLDIKTASRFQLSHCLRVLPISSTTSANDSSIEEAIKILVKTYFTPDNKTYSIIAKASLNEKYGSTRLKQLVGSTVDPTYKLDYNNADMHIWVQVIKNICFIGVLDNYKAYKKYNVSQLNEHKM